MLRVWRKYYELTKILRVDKSTASWGKLKAVVKMYEQSIHSAQIVKILKIGNLIERLKMPILCLFSTRLCAALKTVLWSLIVEIKLLKCNTHGLIFTYFFNSLLPFKCPNSEVYLPTRITMFNSCIFYPTRNSK